MKKYFVVMISTCALIQGSDFFKNQLPEVDQQQLVACFAMYTPTQKAVEAFNTLVDRHPQKIDFPALVICEARRQHNNQERAVVLLNELLKIDFLFDRIPVLAPQETTPQETISQETTPQEIMPQETTRQETALEVAWWQGLPRVCAWLITETKPSRFVLERVQKRSNTYIDAQCFYAQITPELSTQQKALRAAQEQCIQLIEERLAVIEETGAVYAGSSSSFKSIPPSTPSQLDSTTSSTPYSADVTPLTFSINTTPFSGTPGRLPSVTFEDSSEDSKLE